MNHYEHIDALHDIMRTAKDFGDIVNYFLDHLGEDDSFLQKGTSFNNHPVIEGLIQKSMESLGEKEAPKKLFLRRIKHKNFIHGTAHIRDKHCMILFFEDSITGIFALSSLTTGQTNIYRLQGTMIPQEGWT